MLARLETADFPNPDDEAALAQLTRKYADAHRSAHNPRFTAQEHIKKTRIIDSLQTRLFAVADRYSTTFKIVDAAGTEVRAATEHGFDAEQWNRYRKPNGFGEGEWPPKSVEGLLKATGREDCLGCMLKEQYNDKERLWLYALRLKSGDQVQFRRDGQTLMGRVLLNSRIKESVVVAALGDLQKQQEVPWLTLLKDETSKASTVATISNYVSTAAFAEDPNSVATESCNCNITEFRQRQMDWHKSFALRQVLTPQREFAVLSLKYMPEGQLVGENIGLLMPNKHDLDEVDSTRTLTVEPDGSAEANDIRYRSFITIGQPEDDFTDAKCYLDFRSYGSFTRFVRHSCDPNTERKEMRYGDARISVLLSKRAIREGEEVTEDLGNKWLMAVGSCGCGSDKCHMKPAGTVNEVMRIPPDGIINLIDDDDEMDVDEEVGGVARGEKTPARTPKEIINLTDADDADYDDNDNNEMDVEEGSEGAAWDENARRSISSADTISATTEAGSLIPDEAAV
ncbi:SET domain-containing protein [Polyplosphaeria fusca]|uniref:SET domain-containing protein n=1 Tax=Polyplosphaeria fusca TaxID=682080 RepID=A0A9P4V2M3_9PLEO|nr:SET domain-containing protein [Polyplosphaeria fusca]